MTYDIIGAKLTFSEEKPTNILAVKFNTFSIALHRALFKEIKIPGNLKMAITVEPF